jgi:ABC-type branched-subunit amino acid transport system ATPase component
MSTGAVLLEARALTKRFGGLAAVHDVSLDLCLGRIHAVIGPNGAGKSTLTNLLSGDLPPTTGTVKLQRLKEAHAILLVEHDMDAVFALADRLTVMVNGQVIATGTPTEIRSDAGVQAAYLGEEH